MNFYTYVVAGGTQKKSGNRAGDTRIPFLCLLVAPGKDKQPVCENQDGDMVCLCAKVASPAEVARESHQGQQLDHSEWLFLVY